MKFQLENLKLIRKSKGLNQEYLAEHLGIDTSTYGKIERGEVQLTVERLFQWAEIIGIQVEDVLNFNSNKGNVSYVPVFAQAGFLAESDQRTFYDDMKHLSIPMFSETDLFMINVEGDSMQPTLSNGDYLIIKQVYNVNEIKFGEPYVISTKDGIAVKRILPNADDSLITLRSDNTYYPDYTVTKKNVVSFWKILGFITKNLAPRNLLERRIQVLEESITKLAR